MLKYNSVFEIIGPVMVGPSSSHTAGAVKIGQFAKKLFNSEIKTIEVIFYGSFAKTYKGHGTDIAIVGGILGFKTDDNRMKHSIDIAKDRGINVIFNEDYSEVEHPNTARIILSNEIKHSEIIGVSIGGGNIKISELNGFKINLYGEYTTLLVENYDKFGAVADVTNILAKYKINIAHMEVSRHTKGENALMIIEIDDKINKDILEEISILNNIKNTAIL